MTAIHIYGPPQSSYLRSVRMACVEKRVDHELAPLEFRSDAHRALHPYMKVPILEHGDVRLYETGAILHYLDRAFDSGITLIPSAPENAARAEQWVSVLSCYMYQHLVKDYAFAYLQAGEGGPDRARIESAMKDVEYDFDLLEAQLARTPYLAGDALSHADVILAPAVQTATLGPEGKAALEARPKLAGWFAAMADRPSARFLAPPPPA